MDAADPDPRSRSSRRRFLIRLLAAAAMLGLLAWALPFRELATALRRIEPAVWVAALAAFLAIHALAAARWRLLMRAAGAPVAYREAATGHAYGLFGNLFLPSVVGGDLVRAGVLLRNRLPRAPVLLGSFVDRGLDLASLLALALFGAIGVPTALDPASRSVFGGIVLVAAAAGLSLVLALWLVPARRLPFRLRRALAQARSATRCLARRPLALAGAVLLSLGGQAALVGLNAELGRRVGLEASFSLWLLVWPLAKLAALLPLTQGGLGVREAALAALFRPFGVGAVEAVAAGLALQVVIVGGGFCGGVIARLLGRRPAAESS